MIEFNHVYYSYKQHKFSAISALSDVTFRIQKGEYVGIIGDNGSGKSTLARLINGLLYPDFGEVIVNGINTNNTADALQIKKMVGMVFQNPDNQLVGSTVEDDIVFGLENLEIRIDEIEKRVTNYLSLLNIGQLRDCNTTTLSGGQKQLVNLAAVMAMEPEYIVLDEPTAMLDPVATMRIRTILRRLHQSGVGVIHITQYPQEIALADTVYVIRQGKIVCQGTPTEIFLQNTYVSNSAPQPQESTALKIVHHLRSLGIEIRPEVLTPEQFVEEICRLKFEMSATTINTQRYPLGK